MNIWDCSHKRTMFLLKRVSPNVSASWLLVYHQAKGKRLPNYTV